MKDDVGLCLKATMAYSAGDNVELNFISFLKFLKPVTKTMGIDSRSSSTAPRCFPASF